jgi:hypothetical protein
MLRLDAHELLHHRGLVYVFVFQWAFFGGQFGSPKFELETFGVCVRQGLGFPGGANFYDVKN